MVSCHREELKEKYDGKLSQELEGPLCEVFSRLMRVMVGRKITVPGSFKKYVGNKLIIDLSILLSSLSISFLPPSLPPSLQ